MFDMKINNLIKGNVYNFSSCFGELLAQMVLADESVAFYFVEVQLESAV